MRDGHEGDPTVLGRLVHLALDINRDGRCALVQEGELRLVVEQTRHAHALLLAPCQKQNKKEAYATLNGGEKRFFTIVTG